MASIMKQNGVWSGPTSSVETLVCTMLCTKLRRNSLLNACIIKWQKSYHFKTLATLEIQRAITHPFFKIKRNKKCS